MEVTGSNILMEHTSETFRVDNYDEIDLCFVVTYTHNICKTVCIYSLIIVKNQCLKLI